jgi:short-subunit dehydrogenase
MNAVITGASKGIGKAISLYLAKKGYNLAICARNKKDLMSFHDQLMKEFPEITVFSMSADMSKDEDISKFVEMIQINMKTVDVLINNAGIYIPGEVHKEEEGTLEKLTEVNLYGPYRLTRALMPFFLKQESGYIFNICSVASLIAYPNGGSYSITKFALHGFTKVLREELKDKGVKVCGIFPGATWSNSWDGVDLPKERLMEAEDIAKAVGLQLDLSPSAVMEDIILRPQLGDL